MTNNYDQATVQPNFPPVSVTEFEEELLNAFGFTCETHGYYKGGNPSLYFFLREGVRDEIQCFESELVFEHAHNGDSIAIKLLEYIKQNGQDDLDAYISSEFSWVSIFQKILKKPECRDIEDICIEGAYTCDKLRSGEFGGWVYRITRESVQYDSTSAAFDRMKKEFSFLAALDLVYQLANSNCLDNEHVPEDYDDDNEIAIECRRQRQALNLIQDYVENHPLAD